HALEGADERDRPGVEAERRVGDEQVRLEGVALAQAVTIGAHALRAVEAEQLRAGRLVTPVAVGAAVMPREHDVAETPPTRPPPRPPRRRGGRGGLFAPPPPAWGRGRGGGEPPPR